MTTIGKELKEERETKGISLREIAEETKINIRFLRDLEEDRLERLPGKFLTRGIIRSYAKFIGMDEEAVLEKYYEQTLEKTEEIEDIIEEEPEEATFIFEDKKESQTIIPRNLKTVMNFFLFLIFFTMILVSIYFIFYQKKPEKAEEPTPIKTEIQDEKIQAQTHISPPQPSPAEEIPAQEEIQGLKLEITFLEDTWIQIEADGRRVLYELMPAGSVHEVEAAEELILQLGNAGGITYILNNKQGKSFGRTGQFKKDIRITLDNYEDFIQIQ